MSIRLGRNRSDRLVSVDFAPELKGMIIMQKFLGTLLVIGGAIVAATPAFAGTSFAPAPIIAAGIPALVAIGTGYLLARKRRND